MQFLHILDAIVLMPLGPQLMRIFRITPAEFGFLVAAYTFSAAASGILFAFFVDRQDRKKAVLFVLFGLSIATFLCAVSPNYLFLIGARITAGAFGGIMNAMILSIIADLFVPARRGRVTGIVMSAFSIASVLGVPISLFLTSLVSWHLPFLFLGIAAILTILAGVRILPPMTAHLGENEAGLTLKGIVSLFFHPPHLLVYLFTFLLMFIGFAIFPYISPYLVFNAGLLESELPYVYFAGGLFTFFTSRTIGRLSDRYGKGRMFRIVATLSILPILWLTGLEKSPMLKVIFVTTVFMILVSGRTVPAMAIVAGSVPARIRGSFMSLNASIQQFSSGVAALVGGIIIGYAPNGTLLHFDQVGYLASSITIITVGVSLFIGRTEHV